ncbi:uncharacterized protein LOC141901855 isoform X2 [Tubulanus polymorphus]|uniref:uncharacterized protein LOC141901855 isoform X2 n=1 Tax=Tubulanus polymorphus TaxID=672921 RepID=UPI003DA3D4C6
MAKSQNKYSTDEIKASVLQLINHYQDDASIFDEVSQLETLENNCSKQKRFAVESLSIYHGKRNANEHQVRSSMVEKLCEVMNSLKHDEPLLQTDQRQRVQVAIDVLKADEKFSWEVFLNELAQNENTRLPLQICWLFDKEQLVSFDRFFTRNLQNSSIFINVINDLKTLLLRVGLQVDDSDEKYKQIAETVIKDTVLYLVKHVYDTDSNKDGQKTQIKKVASAILDKLIKGLCDEIGSLDNTIKSPFMMIRDVANIDMNILKKFAAHQMMTIIKHNPHYKVLDVIAQQDQWTYAKNAGGVSTMFKQMLVVFEHCEILGLLKRVLLNQEVNWKAALLFVATYLICFKDARAPFLDLVKDLISGALDNLESDRLIAAMLLVRQASLQGPQVFPTYQSWFQDMFQTESTSLANNRKSFTFLSKFLSDIVPFEPAFTLRAHILKPPFIPPKCAQIYNEYVALAKTRLSDLKETVEGEVVIFKRGERSTLDKDSQLKSDIENALVAFEESGKVPSAILEVSMFRRPYYVGKFLPELLKPRVLPKHPDSKMKFIEALHKLGKLPINMFNAYIQKCKERLTNGYESSESITELPVPVEPLAKLRYHLEELEAIILSDHSSASKMSDFGVKLAAIATSISHLTGLEPCTENECIKIAVHEHDSFSPETIKTSELVFSSYGRITGTKINGFLHEFSSRFINMLSQYPSVIACMCKLGTVSIKTKVTALTDENTECYACFAAELLACPLLKQLSLIGADDQTLSLVELHLSLLPMTSKVGQKLRMKYLVHFFCLASHRSVTADLSRPAAQMNYMLERFCPELRHDWIGSSTFNILNRSDQKLLEEIKSFDEFERLFEVNRITVNEWLEYEICMNPLDDFLNEIERQLYRNWYITIRMQGDDNPWKLLSAMFQNLVTHYQSSSDPLTYSSATCMLNLLQSCVYELQHNPYETGEGQSWLFEQLLWCIDLVIKQEANNRAVVVTGVELQIFFRIASKLPAYLLFKKRISDEVDKHIAKQLGDLLQTYLRNYCTNGKYGSLQHHTTLFIVKAIHCDSRLMHAFLMRCPPSLSFSLMVHWPALKNAVKLEQGWMDDMWNWAESCLRGIVKENLAKPWLKACSLFAVFCNLSCTNHRLVELQQYLLITVTSLELDCVVHLMICNLVYLQCMTTNEESSLSNLSVQLFVKIVKTQWNVIGSLLQHISHPTRKIFSDHMFSLLPYTFFRCFSHLSHYDLNSCAAVLPVETIERILLLYNDISHQYDTGLPAQGACESSNIMVKIYESVKQLITRLPKSHRTEISKDVIESCDQGVQMLFTHN